jgi:quinol monooxygenase YgiN
MATILAHIRVKHGCEADFELIIRTLFTSSHASDKGLRRYEYWRAQETGLYYCLLAFDDFLAFMAHQSSAHHETATPALMAVITDLRLEWLDPVQGASPLPMTATQQVPDAASDLVKRYAEMMPVSIADWWLPLRATDKAAASRQFS